jgi:hypothetical protein
LEQKGNAVTSDYKNGAEIEVHTMEGERLRAF